MQTTNTRLVERHDAPLRLTLPKLPRVWTSHGQHFSAQILEITRSRAHLDLLPKRVELLAVGQVLHVEERTARQRCDNRLDLKSRTGVDLSNPR